MQTLKEKAALQVLCQFLGYDEGIFYFNLLNKENFNHLYSHSKKYRIFQSLYNAGAIIKLKNLKEKKEAIIYAPLPPTFLYDESSENLEDIIAFLENLYFKNYKSLFEENYFEAFACYNSRLDLFLIKYFMKDYALLMLGSSQDIPLYKKHLKKDRFEKLTCLCRKDYIGCAEGRLKKIPGYLIGNRRLLIIDGKLAIEMLKLPNSRSEDRSELNRYSGYILSGELKVKSFDGDYLYIKRLEEEFNLLLRSNYE